MVLVQTAAALRPSQFRVYPLVPLGVHVKVKDCLVVRLNFTQLNQETQWSTAVEVTAGEEGGIRNYPQLQGLPLLVVDLVCC